VAVGINFDLTVGFGGCSVEPAARTNRRTAPTLQQSAATRMAVELTGIKTMPPTYHIPF
jgi:hypothetical protein